jgi:hypothetical protein
MATATATAKTKATAKAKTKATAKAGTRRPRISRTTHR